jgi:Sensors of blue-light using FAD
LRRFNHGFGRCEKPKAAILAEIPANALACVINLQQGAAKCRRFYAAARRRAEAGGSFRNPSDLASKIEARVPQGTEKDGQRQTSTMLERITYVSRAAPGMRREDVFGIIRAAYPQNQLAGISGALIFLDGWFVQLLEGTPEALAATRSRIARDPRHQGLLLRSREQGGLSRLFPGQAMALRTRACIAPDLLAEFAYRPGFPVADFPADVLVEFLVQACHRLPARPERLVS